MQRKRSKLRGTPFEILVVKAMLMVCSFSTLLQPPELHPTHRVRIPRLPFQSKSLPCPVPQQRLILTSSTYRPDDELQLPAGLGPETVVYRIVDSDGNAGHRPKTELDLYEQAPEHRQVKRKKKLAKLLLGGNAVPGKPITTASVHFTHHSKDDSRRQKHMC